MVLEYWTPLKTVSLSEMMFFISFGIPITYEKHCMKRLFFMRLLCSVLHLFLRLMTTAKLKKRNDAIGLSY